MEAFVELLAMGARLLDETGRLMTEPASVEAVAASPSLLIVDLEMSGSNAQTHEVLDIGGIRATFAADLPEEEAWGARVKPKHIGNAVPGALKVVGYTSKGWREAIDLDDAIARFTALGVGGVITGWGIGQDMAFLAESYRRTATPWPFAPFALDVQPIARYLLRDGNQVDRYNLGHVADRLGIGRLGEHGALADAYATYDVLVALVKKALG